MPPRVPLASQLGPTFICACLYSFVVVYCTWAGLRMFTKETSFEAIRLIKKTWTSQTLDEIKAVPHTQRCSEGYEDLLIEDLTGTHQKLKVWPIQQENGEVLPMRLCKSTIKDYTYKELFERTLNNCTISDFHACKDGSNLMLCIPNEYDCPISEIQFGRRHKDNIQEETVFNNFYLTQYRTNSMAMSGLIFRKADLANDPFLISTQQTARISDIKRENQLSEFDPEDSTKYTLFMLPVPQMTSECSNNMKFLRFLHHDGWLSDMIYWQQLGIILNLVFLAKVFFDIYSFDPSLPTLNIRHLESSKNNKRYVMKYLVTLVLFGLIQATPIIFALQELQEIMDFLNMIMEHRCLDYKTYNSILKVNKDFIESCMTYDACNIGFFVVGVGALIWSWWSDFQDFELVMDNQKLERELDAQYGTGPNPKFFEEIELSQRDTSGLISRGDKTITESDSLLKQEDTSANKTQTVPVKQNNQQKEK